MSISDRNVQFVRAITLAMALGGGVFALAIPPISYLGLRAALLGIALVNAGLVFLVFRKAAPVSRLGTVALAVLCVVTTQALCILLASLAILLVSQGLLWPAGIPTLVFETMRSFVGLLPELVVAVLAYAAHVAVYGCPEPVEHATSQPLPPSMSARLADRSGRFSRRIVQATAVSGILYALAFPPLFALGSHASLIVVALANTGLMFLVFPKMVPTSRLGAVAIAVLCAATTQIVALLLTAQGNLGLIRIRFLIFGSLEPLGFLLPELIAGVLAYALHIAIYDRPERGQR